MHSKMAPTRKALSSSSLLELKSESKDYQAVDVDVGVLSSQYGSPVFASSTAPRLETRKSEGKFGIPPAGFRLTSGYTESPRPPGQR
jgi:hypothetical protein